MDRKRADTSENIPDWAKRKPSSIWGTREKEAGEPEPIELPKKVKSKKKIRDLYRDLMGE